MLHEDRGRKDVKDCGDGGCNLRAFAEPAGYSIPKFLGVGSLYNVVDILILEDCGDHDFPVKVEDVLALLRQIHAEGVLHGDIRRQNVVCRALGKCVLIDSGKSKIGNVSEADKVAELEKARSVFSES